MTSRIFASPGSLWTVLTSPDHGGKLLRGTAGSMMVRVAASGLLFLSHIVFARRLGVDGFGIYVLTLAWLAVLVLLGRVGFDFATVRFVAAYKSRQEWALLRGFLTAGRAIVLGCSVLVAAAFAASIGLIAPDGPEALRGTLRIAALATPVLALVQFEAAAVRALGHVVLGEVPLAVGQPALLIAGFLVAVLWLGFPAAPQTAMWTFLLASLAPLLWLWLMLRARLPEAAHGVARAFRWHEWMTTAPAMILVAGFAAVLNQSTVMMIGALAGPAEAGLFGAAARIAGILQIITFPLIGAIGPMIAGLHAAAATDMLQKAIDTGVRTVFALAFIATLALCVLGEWVLTLFGDAFAPAFPALLVLLAGQAIWAGCAAAGAVLNMTGHQNASAAILAAAAAANLGLCWLLIPRFGLQGAAVATAVSMAGSNIAMAVHARRVTGLRSYASLARRCR